jgi:hypothetical protein
MIKTQSPYVQNYYPSLGYDYWFGSLTNVGLTNEAGYQINVSNPCEVIMTGVIANPADHPIMVQSGWNWIGYPVTTQQGLASGLANFTPSANDLIKGQSSSATYYANYGWFPTSFTLTPGQCYMYYSNAMEDKTLTYAAGRDNNESSLEAEKVWTNDIHAYADNITVIAVVTIDGEEQSGEDMEVGAFVDGECRGSAVLAYFEPTDRWYAVMTIAGEEGDEIDFAIVNRNNGESIESSISSMVFVPNAVMGNLDNPYEIVFGFPCELPFYSNATTNTLRIYPNPTESNTTFTLDIPSDEAVNEIAVYNTLGEIVLREIGSQDGHSMRGLPKAGIYMVRVVCKSGNTYIGRLIVK